MSVVRSPVRSVVRSPVRGVLGGGVNLLGQATSYLKGIAPYHWFDFINDRCLYASNDVGGVSGATGYSFSRASTGYYTNADGTLTLFASGALRRGNRGVLIEGARTNLLLRSQEFDDAGWVAGSGGAAVVTADATAAPDATMTADTLNDNSAAAVRGIARSTTVANDTASHTGSVFIRAGTSGVASLRLTYSGGTSVAAELVVRLSDGAAQWRSGASGASFTSEVLASGWVRISATLANNGLGNTSLSFELRPCFAGTYQNTVDATAQGTAFFWGAQLEAASFPSSYIPTTTASATRAADVLTCTAGVSYPLSLWAEINRIGTLAFTNTALQVDSGSNNERAILGSTAGDLATAIQITGGSTVAAPTVAGAMALNTTYKIASRFQANNCNVAQGGVLGTNDTTCAEPAASTALRFGSDVAGGGIFFGYLRRAAIFNSALSDANLQTVTT